jgi:hypothetical protein
VRAWSSARFSFALPYGHRFPLIKYARLRDEVVRHRGIPLVVTMAGGCARRLEDVIDIQGTMVGAALAAYA